MPRKRARGNGEGSVRKRSDGNWEARYTAGHTPDGKQQSKSVYGRTRAEVAQKLGTALALHAELPRDPAALTVTLADYLERIAAQRVGQVSERTCEIDQSHIALIRQATVGAMLLRELRTGHLEEYYRALAQTHSKSVVQHVRIFINLALRHAVRNGHLVHHPGLLAELPRMESRKIARVLEVTDIQRLLSAARDGRWYPFVYLAVSLGLRHGELLGLQWADLNIQKGELLIQRSVGNDRAGTIRIGPLKTKGSYRTAYLDQDQLDLLSTLRAQQVEAGLITPWVFANNAGGPLSQHNVRREYRKLLQQAEIEVGTRVHDLRHTFTTLHIMGGTDPKTVSSMVGHADSRFTLDIYTHVSEERKKATAARTSAVLGLSAPKPASKPKKPSMGGLELKHFKARKKGA